MSEIDGRLFLIAGYTLYGLVQAACVGILVGALYGLDRYLKAATR